MEREGGPRGDAFREFLLLLVSAHESFGAFLHVHPIPFSGFLSSWQRSMEFAGKVLFVALFLVMIASQGRKKTVILAPLSLKSISASLRVYIHYMGIIMRSAASSWEHPPSLRRASRDMFQLFCGILRPKLHGTTPLPGKEGATDAPGLQSHTLPPSVSFLHHI